MVEHTGTDVTFKNVLSSVQQGIQLLTFTIDGATLVKLAKVRRHSEDGESGVQRNQRLSKCRKYKKALLGGSLFVESINVSLNGDWIYDPESCELVGERGPSGDLAEFEILDGQHRVGALELIIQDFGEERARDFEFTIIAVVNASDVQRAQIFLGQAERLGMDQSHAAALRHRAGSYKNDVERFTYELLELLNERDDSPIKGRIGFGDSIDVDGKRVRHKGIYPVRSLFIHARALFSTRRTNKCMFRNFSPQEIKGIVLRAFRALAAENNLFALESAREDRQSGSTLLTMTAFFAFLAGHRQVLLRMMMSSSNAGNPEITYSEEAFREVFRHTARFQWKPKDSSHRSPHHIAERLDRFIDERWPRD